jgi:hypothetical protein
MLRVAGFVVVAAAVVLLLVAGIEAFFGFLVSVAILTVVTGLAMLWFADELPPVGGWLGDGDGGDGGGDLGL